MSMQSFKGFVPLLLALAVCPSLARAQIGAEKSVSRHLADGEEFLISANELIDHGKKLFEAVWTIQEGGGRPQTKGTGAPLSDPRAPLVFPRNFNRISAPDSNSCFGCHAQPRSGGGGDIVANVFVLGQRFDFATFDNADFIGTKGARDEVGNAVTVQSIADERLTLGMFGSGFIEMLARQMTAELQAIRDATAPGGSKALVSKGISFGIIARTAAGTWITSGVRGIPSSSLVPDGSSTAPSLIIRPFHQAGRVISLREFTNNAFNHHHGIQSTERFGIGTDPDGDGIRNELTRADVTAVTLFQATLPVPGRVIPRSPAWEEAIKIGEAKFNAIGCAECHVPTLPLTNKGWIYTEPNPYNPPGNLRPGEAPILSIDLTSDALPQPRLKPDKNGVVHVPAFTDLKLHDICAPGADPNAELLDMQQTAGSPEFFAGNRKFITRKLWGTANEPPFFHHGRFTTLREATLAHDGEALASRKAFQALAPAERDAIIEFLKSLRTLPEGTRFLAIDERGNPRPNFAGKVD
jgi:hypothetical protein